MTPVAQPRFSRRSFLRTTLAVGGGLAAAPVLAACGGSSTDDDGPGGPTKVTFGIKDNPTTFDPYFHNTPNFCLLYTLNSYLIDYDDDLQPVPSIAESWEPGPEHADLVVTLREGVTFHSGASVTADDIVTGFARGKDPAEGASLVGALATVTACEKVDERTVRFVFAYPVAENIMTDVLYAFPVVEGKFNTAEQLKTTPASCGPFTLGEFVSGQSITLARFEEYWDAETPLAGELAIQIFDSVDTMATALQSGSIDGATFLLARQADQLQDDFTVITGFPGALVDVFQMNPHVAPWDNKTMRQALVRAIDRDRIVEEVRYGYSQPVVLPYPPISPGSDPDYLTKYGFDLAAAKALWEQAGSPAGGEVAVPQNPETQQLLEVIQADLKKIGFDLQIVPMDTTTYVEQANNGELPSAAVAIANSFLTPSRIATNTAFRTEANTWWKDTPPAAYIEAIDACNRAIEEADQTAAYDRLNEVLLDECWAVGVGLRQFVFATAKDVEGFRLAPGDEFVFDDVTTA